MRQRLLIIVAVVLLGIAVNFMPTTAQDATPEHYNPACAVILMKAYLSGWEYDHRGSEGEIDPVAAAQVARDVYQAFSTAKVNCDDTAGNLKQILLGSMHSEYSAADLTRMLAFIDEAVGKIDPNECAYTITIQYVRQVDWGKSTAVEVGRNISELFRAVRDVVQNNSCTPTLNAVSEVMSHIEHIPADGTLVASLYKAISDATQNHYISDYACNYILAKTFLEKVEWNGLDATHIVNLVSNTFNISYQIADENVCDSNPAWAITAELLEDAYHFPPDASIIQQTYDAATGNIQVTPEATPIVN